MRKTITLLFGSVLLCGAVLASVVLVDLAADPPEVIQEDSYVSDCERESSGISFAIEDATSDLYFMFVGLEENAPVSYEVYAGGVPVYAGDGAFVPLSECSSADRIDFFSPDESVDWGAVTEVRTEQRQISDNVRVKSEEARKLPDAAIAFTASRLRSANLDTESYRCVATSNGFLLASVGCETDPCWGGPENPSTILTTLDGFQGSYPYHEGDFLTGVSGLVYLQKNQDFSFRVGADDWAILDVGGIGTSQILGENAFRWGNWVEGTVPEDGFYAFSLRYGTVGGPYKLAFEGFPYALYSGRELIPYAGFDVTEKVVTLHSHLPFVDSRVVPVNVTNRDSRVSCTLNLLSGPGRLSRKTDDQWEYVVTTMDVSTQSVAVIGMTQYCYGAEWTSEPQEIVIYLDPSSKPVEKECCNCPISDGGSDSKNNCVSFSQRFGTTPDVSAAPWGRLCIEVERPDSALATPAVLRYDHPLERRLTGTARGFAKVVPPLGHVVTYFDGAPRAASVTLDSRLVDVPDAAEPTVREVFSDRSEIVYVNGIPAELVTADGVHVPVSELGIEVIRDEDGAIRQIRSTSDGLLDVVPSGQSRFRVNWYAPSAVGGKSPSTGLYATQGSPAKYFDMGTPQGATAGRSFSLLEYRSQTLQFQTRWDWSVPAGDWAMTRGLGNETVSVSRSISSNDDGTFDVTKTFSSSSGVSSETVTTYSAQDGIAPVSETRGGRPAKSIVRIESGVGRGRPGETTDRRGLVTDSSYDGSGRVLERRETGGPLARTAVYAYSCDNGTPDFAPTGTVNYVNGIMVSVRTYERIGSREDGLCERTVNVVGNVARTNLVFRYASLSENRSEAGRIAFSVSADGSAVTNSYVRSNGALYVHTATKGIWDSSGFRTVDGKSTRTRTTYDMRGDAVAEATDALVGGVWREMSSATHTYSLIHQRRSTVRSDGRSSDSERICTGPVWTRDENGILTTNSFDSVKRIVRSVRSGPFGDVTEELTLDAEGRTLARTRSAIGCETQTESFSYDLEGRVVSSTDSQGRTTTTAYSDDDLVTTVTYADGGTRVTTLNADGSLHSVTGTAVTPEYHTYGVTADGLEWECVRYGRADSPRFEKTYRNGFGETVRTERSGFGGATLVTDSVYDAKGRLVSTAETGKPSVTYSYDDWGDLVSTVATADGVSRATESDSGNVILDGEVWNGRSRTVRTSDGSIVPLVTESYSKLSGLSLNEIENSFTVDVRGNTNRVTSALDPSIAARTTTEDRAGLSNRAVSMTLDGFENSSTGFNGASTIAFADAYRRGLTHRDGRGNVSRTYYDNFGRVSSRVDADGNATSFGYDAMGRLAATTNALGLVTTYEYDLRGNKTYEGGATYPVRYAYDVYGNRTSMTTYRDEPLSQGVEGRARTPAAPQAGDTTSWVYDEATGLVTEKRYADGTSVCYTYSDDGKLTSRVWARGVTTTYAYDGWGNLVSTTYSDGTPSVTLSYDALGRLVTANDVTGTTTYSYDEYGDEAQVATSGLYSKTLTRHRDEYGRDLGHTMDGSRKNIIEYEPTTGRIKRTMLGGAWFTWDYLPGSDLKSRLTYGGSGNTEWTYEPHRDLLTRVKNTIYGSVVSQYDYTNDEIGRRTAIARSGSKMTETRSDAYGYNDRSELTNAVKNATLNEYAYQYDDIGNRETAFERGTGFTYEANNLNQYTTVGRGLRAAPLDDVFSPTYDLDGNQTLVQTKTGIWSITYNGENRPVLWTCGTTNLVMKFDRMGRRVEYVESVGSVTNRHQKFVYDGYLCIQRLNGTNNSITELFEWDPTEPVATRPMFMQYRVPGQTYALFYTHDGNKNVSEVVHFSRANGVAAHYEYAPFGEVTAQVRQGGVAAYDFAALNPWRFSSEYADDASATVYYNYRHYEPVMGRWLSRDPIDLKGDICTRLYTFDGCPIWMIDFLGEKTQAKPASRDKYFLDLIKLPAGKFVVRVVAISEENRWKRTVGENVLRKQFASIDCTFFKNVNTSQGTQKIPAGLVEKFSNLVNPGDEIVVPYSQYLRSALYIVDALWSVAKEPSRYNEFLQAKDAFMNDKSEASCISFCGSWVNYFANMTGPLQGALKYASGMACVSACIEGVQGCIDCDEENQ